MVTKETYDRIAEDYCATTKQYSTATALVNMAGEFADRLQPASRVLVLGAGDGRDADVFCRRGHRPLCIDYSIGMMAVLSASHPYLPACCVDMRELDLPSGTIDAVWASTCLYHIPREDLPGVFVRIFRCLKPRGWLYFNLRLGTGEQLDSAARSYPYGGQRYYAFYSRAEALALVAASDVVECVTNHPVLNDYVHIWAQAKDRNR